MSVIVYFHICTVIFRKDDLQMLFLTYIFIIMQFHKL